jgi:hypothetical protein
MLHAELQDEEFQEADILWPDAAQGREKLPAVYYYPCSDTDDDDHDEFSGENGLMRLQIGQRASSPIDIPGRKGEKGAKAQPGSSKLGASRASSGGSGSGSVMIGSHVFVPPHVIVDRRAKREKAMMLFVVPSGRRARKTREQY